ncbi:MAG: GNAT family N-acetyltransferase [Thermoleophilia bacterium]|nr:GNAT family N-acetyltransferase [Thermoleophilia bacterium]
MPSSRLVTAVEPFTAALEAEWDALAHRVDAPPFLRPAYVRVRHAAFEEGAGFAVVTVRRDGILHGALPVADGTAGFGPPSNYETPLEGIVADDPAAMREVAATLMTLPAPRVVFTYLRAGGPSRAVIDAAVSAAGRRAYSRTTIRVPVVDTAGAWDDYWASRSRNLRHNVERCARRAREAGELVFEVHDAFEDGRLDALLQDGFAVEASGWKGAEGTAILADPRTRTYYTELAAWAAGEGWLRLAFVRLDGVAIAFCFGIEAHGVHYALKVGYEDRMKKLSPGMLLMRGLIQRSFETGLRSFDFAGHDAAWKSAWATGIDEYEGTLAFAPSVAGRASHARYRCRRWVADGPLRPALERAAARVRGGRRRTEEPPVKDPSASSPKAAGAALATATSIDADASVTRVESAG